MLTTMLHRLWRRQKGQSLVLVAVAMVVMIGIIGLATDVGLLMSARRGLVRLTDAAALAAASALTGFSSESDVLRQSRATDRAYEYVRLNGFDPTPNTGNISITVTFPSTTRKVVEVTTSRRVALAFMRLFGLSQSTVTSAARQGESIPLDIVMVMDTSGSQFLGNHELYSAARDLIKQPWPYPGDIYNVPRIMRASGFGYNPALITIDYYWPPTATILYPHNKGCDTGAGCGDGRVNVPWQPFAMQQEAAHYFINQLDSRYDKVAIVCFSTGSRASPSPNCGDKPSCVKQALTSNFSLAHTAIGYSPTVSGTRGVKGLWPLGGTAMAAGMNSGLVALTTFPPARQDAVGVMILLTDGSPTHRLDGTLCSGCDQNNPGNCSNCRSDVMVQAQLAAAKGIVIYTIFVGSAAYETQYSLILQWVADLTDNGQLEGNYTSPRNLPTGYGPAYEASWFQANVSENYYRASNQTELEAAYQSIFEKVYTRLIK